MNIKTITKIFFYLLIATIIIYIRITKIPILCLACEENGIFTRCISGTGNGTPTCDAYHLHQEMVGGINRVYNDIENTFGQIVGPLNVAYDKIQEAKRTLVDAFSRISSLNIPPIPDINIPPIPSISCAIDFGAIPAFDVCSPLTVAINDGAIGPMRITIDTLNRSVNTVIEGLNQTIAPINTGLKESKDSLNKIVGGINTAIRAINKPLGLSIDEIDEVDIKGIPTINDRIGIPLIDPVNLNCNFDIAQLIRNSFNGQASINLCTLLATAMETVVNKLNEAFKKVGDGISIAIENINNGVTNAINTIKTGISNAISMLEQQLEALQIFEQITNKIVDLITKIQSLNPIGLLKIYVIPYIQAYFPFATVTDTLTFLLFLVSIPFIVPLLFIINSLIDLIPDVDIPIFKSSD